MYVCGDVAVGTSIRDALVKIAQAHGKYGPFKAQVCCERERDERRRRRGGEGEG